MDADLGKRLVAAAHAAPSAASDEQIDDEDEREDYDDRGDRTFEAPPGVLCGCLLHVWYYAVPPPADVPVPARVTMIGS
jgi:hypothetical protein